MPYELFLALRYLRARRGRRVARWTALAAVAGIACGVAALTVATALANGFRDELRDKILRGTAHVTLAREGGAIEDPRAVAERVRGIEGVLDAQPTTYEGALLSGPNGAAYTLLRGLDGHSTRAVSDVQSTLTKGTLDALFQNTSSRSQNLAASKSQPNSPRAPQTNSTSEAQAESPVPVVVGAELAARTGLSEVGDEGWVLTGAASSGAGGVGPRARRARLGPPPNGKAPPSPP